MTKYTPIEYTADNDAICLHCKAGFDIPDFLPKTCPNCGKVLVVPSHDDPIRAMKGVEHYYFLLRDAETGKFYPVFQYEPLDVVWAGIDNRLI